MNKHNFLNIFSLFLIQGSNALFSLVLFPYLFTIFDTQTFSVLVILESLMLYVVAVSSYSFDVTGVKDVGLAGSNKEKIDIFYDVLFIRLAFFLVIFLPSLLLTSFFFNEFFLTVFFWFLFPLGVILQCNYYYQAIEENIKFSIVVFICRFSSFLLVLILVKNNNDLNLVSLIIGSSYFLSGLISLFFLVSNLKFSDYTINIKRLRHRFKEGVGLYLGGLSVALFRGSNILLLSLVSSSVAVSIYALAEKFIKTVQALIRPLNQFSYPKVVKDVKSDKSVSHVFKVILKRTIPQVTILILGMFALLFSGLIAKHYDLLPNNINKAYMVFFIMSFATIFGVCNYMFGTIGLSLINLNSYYAKSVFLVGVISVLITIFLGYCFNQYGAALAYTLSEAMLLLIFMSKFKYYK